MKNITVTVADDIYRQARIWAAQRDTSLSAVVAYLLATLPGRKTRAEQRFPLPAPVATTPQSPDTPAFTASSTQKLAMLAAGALSAQSSAIHAASGKIPSPPAVK